MKVTVFYLSKLVAFFPMSHKNNKSFLNLSMENDHKIYNNPHNYQSNMTTFKSSMLTSKNIMFKDFACHKHYHLVANMKIIVHVKLKKQRPFNPLTWIGSWIATYTWKSGQIPQVFMKGTGNICEGTWYHFS